MAAPIRQGDHIQFGDTRYTVKRTVIHPEGVGEMGRPPKVDLALVELAEPVKEIEPVALYRGREELGQTLFIVGPTMKVWEHRETAVGRPYYKRTTRSISPGSVPRR